MVTGLKFGLFLKNVYLILKLGKLKSYTLYVINNFLLMRPNIYFKSYISEEDLYKHPHSTNALNIAIFAKSQNIHQCNSHFYLKFKLFNLCINLTYGSNSLLKYCY